jgi:hypothetical protein
MIHPRRDRLAILSVALLAPVLAGACGGLAAKSAPVPCTSGVWLHIPLDLKVGAMAEPNVSVCRNSECTTSVFPPLPSGWPQAMSTTADITGTLSRNSDGTITLDIEWNIADESQLVDGDHYVVTIADGAGLATTVLDRIATYSRSASGPADSGPTCLQAILSP